MIMHDVGDSRHALFKLEAKMGRRGVYVLSSEYFIARVNLSKVVMELLEYSAQADNITQVSPPNLEALASR